SSVRPRPASRPRRRGAATGSSSGSWAPPPRPRWAEVASGGPQLTYTRAGASLVGGAMGAVLLLTLGGFVSLPVLGAGALVTLFLLAWREGGTLEPSRGTIRCWSGPFFPVISTRIELADDS